MARGREHTDMRKHYQLECSLHRNQQHPGHSARTSEGSTFLVTLVDGSTSKAAPVYTDDSGHRQQASATLLSSTNPSVMESENREPAIPTRMSSRKLIKRAPIQRDSKPEPINTSGLHRSSTQSRQRTRSELGSMPAEKVDDTSRISPWRTWGRRTGDKRSGSDAPPSAWTGNRSVVESPYNHPPPLPVSSLGRRLTKSISFTRPKDPKYAPERSSQSTDANAGFAAALEARRDRGKMESTQTPGENVHGIDWQTQDAIKPYTLLRPLSPLEVPTSEMAAHEKEVIMTASPTTLSPETPISAIEMNSEDWHHADGSADTHATTVYAESSRRFSIDSNCTPALSMMTFFSPSAGPTRQNSLSISPALLTPSVTSTMAYQSELLYRKSTTAARRPQLQRTLAMSQMSATGIDYENGEQVPTEQEVVRLNHLDGKRRNRQSLMQIEDDTAFAKVVTELMRADKEEQVKEEETEGWMVIRGMASPSLEMTKHTKTMRAFFLVRELLIGERNYRKHLVQGIEVSSFSARFRDIGRN